MAADTFPSLTGVQDPESPSDRADRDYKDAESDRTARNLKSQTAERLARNYVEDSTGANTEYDSVISGSTAGDTGEKGEEMDLHVGERFV